MPLEITLPAPVQLLQAAQLPGLAQAGGGWAQVPGQGGQAAGQGLGLAIPEQQTGREVRTELGLEFGSQLVWARPLAIALHQEPGGLTLGKGLQPTQLRIGLVISRGSGSENLESTPRGGIPEIARVEGNLIVVEPYQSRTVWARRRE